MKKLLSLCFFLFLSCKLLGQVAIIQDKDGYTNVRKDASTKSEIIYKLVDNEVFFHYEAAFDSDVDNENWVYVMIPRNHFSIITDLEKPYYYGYIHRSRLKPLNQLEKIPYPQKDKLIFQISKVDTLEKKVDNLIDGYAPYGLDIYLHQSTQVNSLKMLWNDKLIPQPNILISDLYNMTFEEGEYNSSKHQFEYYKNNESTFLVQECADGGGYYQIVWVVKDQKIVQRLAGWIY
jgi:hypothetical protein